MADDGEGSARDHTGQPVDGSDHRAGNLSEYGDSEQEQQKRRGRGSQTAAPTASPKGIARPAYIAG